MAVTVIDTDTTSVTSSPTDLYSDSGLTAGAYVLAFNIDSCTGTPTLSVYMQTAIAAIPYHGHFDATVANTAAHVWVTPPVPMEGNVTITVVTDADTCALTWKLFKLA